MKVFVIFDTCIEQVLFVYKDENKCLQKLKELQDKSNYIYPETTIVYEKFEVIE